MFKNFSQFITDLNCKWDGNKPLGNNISLFHTRSPLLWGASTALKYENTLLVVQYQQTGLLSRCRNGISWKITQRRLAADTGAKQHGAQAVNSRQWSAVWRTSSLICWWHCNAWYLTSTWLLWLLTKGCEPFLILYETIFVGEHRLCITKVFLHSLSYFFSTDSPELKGVNR